VHLDGQGRGCVAGRDSADASTERPLVERQGNAGNGDVVMRLSDELECLALLLAILLALTKLQGWMP